MPMAKKHKRAYSSLEDYLNDLRRDGQNQAQFAAHFGISEGYLSDIKNGKQGCSLRLAKRFSDECNIPITAFLLDQEEAVS